MVNLLMCILVCISMSEASLVSSLSKRHASSCDPNFIYRASQECYGDLIHLSELPTTAQGEQLHNVLAMCSTVEDSSWCFYRKMRRCGDAGETMATMLGGVFKFVCSEKGVKVLMASGACWAHDTLREDIGRCTEAMERGFKTTSFNDWCDVTRSYIRCIGYEVRSKQVCDHRAAEFIQQMVRISIKPSMDRLHCRNYRSIRSLNDVIQEALH